MKIWNTLEIKISNINDPVKGNNNNIDQKIYESFSRKSSYKVKVTVPTKVCVWQISLLVKVRL